VDGWGDHFLAAGSEHFVTWAWVSIGYSGFVKRHTLIFIGCIMTTIAAPRPVRATDEPTGASLAWTSSHPAVVQARKLLAEGKFAEAEQTVQTSDPAGVEMREIIRRLRAEYSLDEAGLLVKLRKSVPDVTPDDLNRWRQAGQVQFRVIDGQVCYFRREPSNIFRFCDEAKKRRDQNTAGSTEKPKFVLTEHLADVIKAVESSGKTQVLPIRHRITYTLAVEPNRPGANRGSQVRCWLPYPQQYRQQKNIRLISTMPSEHAIAPDDAPQRTIYLEQRIDDPSKPLKFEAVYEYDSYAYYPQLSDANARPLPANWTGPDLAERPPHIVFTPELNKAVEQIIGSETNPLARARKIFHWIDANIRYHAEEEYCVIPGFSQAALSRRRGDCGIQSMLFITMCRRAGIPARWQSGWETKPVDWNMHDWVEFYVEPWGWLPADPSYGLQKSDDPKIREFYFGHQDSYRMIVNRDYGNPLVPEKQSLRSEPADFQRGEVEIDGRNLYFDEWDYDFKFEQTSLPG
jgi:transglutaminase-like putative cysteine protease